MSEIDSLNASTYYSGVQNSSSEAVKKNKKNEEIKSSKKTRFSDILNHTDNNEAEFSVAGLPPEVATMPIEDAAIFLKDAVDNTGNDLADEINEENLKKFRTAVSQFLLFVVNNNYEVKSHRKKNSLGRDKIVPSRTNFFSNYSLPPHRIDPRYQIKVINEKLSALTAATLDSQRDNLLILAQIDSIKGLIIDLMSS